MTAKIVIISVNLHLPFVLLFAAQFSRGFMKLHHLRLRGLTEAFPSEVCVDFDALGPGLREWFGSLGDHRVRAAAFDTRMHGPAALTGRAAKGVSHLLRQHGFDVVAEPESFLVTKQDRLEPHETIRAREWGTRLAASVAPSPAQGTRS